MSSTNRGSTREEKDYYRTPIYAIEDFLVEFNKICILEDKIVFDPSAGGDITHPMPYQEALKKYIKYWKIITNDIREDSPAFWHLDYLNTPYITESDPAPDIIMTNPPFGLSLEFTKKALKEVKSGGFVVMLNRLNFFGCAIRKPFWDKFMPLYTFVHSKRMSFTDNGKTDSIEYAHFVWQKDNYPEFTKLKVI